MPNSGPGAKIEGFMGSLINPSRHGDGEAASYGGAIEGDAYQYEREEAPQDRYCDVRKLSFMLETRARRSLGVALGDAQSLVEGGRRAGIVGQAPFLRGSSPAIATCLHIFTKSNIHIFTKLGIHIFAKFNIYTLTKFNKFQFHVRVSR